MLINKTNEQNKETTGLFNTDQNEVSEKKTAEFTQYNLTSGHVTLCRENEIEPIDRVIKNLRLIKIFKNKNLDLF